MENKLKIIFIGIPDMGLVCLSNLLEKNFNIAGVIPPPVDNESYFYFKNFVKDKGLNLLDFENSPNEKPLIEKIKSLNADIGVCCSYNLKLNKEFLSSTRLGFINCHPSLLPMYRGAMPYFHIINNGEKESGITLHFMDENFDTGDIIYQEKFNLIPDETMGILFNRTTYMLSDALIKILKKIENNEEIKRFPQNKEIKVIKAPKVPSNFKFNRSKNIIKTDRLIKASNPFFNVYAVFRQTSFKIIKAHIIEKEDIKQEDFGRIIQADENNLIIALKGGKLSLDVFQVGTWGVFTPKDFYYTFSPRNDEYIT